MPSVPEAALVEATLLDVDPGVEALEVWAAFVGLDFSQRKHVLI